MGTEHNGDGSFVLFSLRTEKLFARTETFLRVVDREKDNPTRNSRLLADMTKGRFFCHVDRTRKGR